MVLPPALESAPTVRYVIATKEVARDLSSQSVRFREARAVVDAFTEGLIISARYPPSKSVRAQLALLEPSSDEVWEFRSRKPKPGARVFGRFADVDLFIALGIEFREEIDDDFAREKEACRRQWRTYFQSYQPLKGNDLSDYLTSYYAV